MHAHKLKIVIPEDHQLYVQVHVQVPAEIPAGPAELIVLVGAADSDKRKIDYTDPKMVVVITDPTPPPYRAKELGEASTEEASRRFVALAERLAADPRPFDELSDEERDARLRQVMGIGRGLLSSSEEFAQQKQEEIDLEERRFGRR